MTGDSGGVRIGRERIVNGPVRVHPKLWRVGWNGCHRYRAMVSDKNPVPEREAYLQVASESISSRNGRNGFFYWKMNLKQGGTVKTISPLYSTGYTGAEWLFLL